MSKEQINEMLRTTLEKVREIVDADTIIGQPISLAEDVKAVPVSQVSIGIAGGGSDFGKEPSRVHFGGGTGAGITVKPISFLIYEKGSVRIISATAAAEAANPYVAAIDAVPVAAERVVELIRDFKAKREDKE